jgi:hypothetical protein
MNSIARLSSQATSLTVEYFWRPIASTLGQRKIIALAATAFCALAACFLFYCNLKRRTIHPIQKNRPIQANEKILKETQLYKGEKGDFYLRIHNYEVSESGKELLGVNNFAKLKRYDNYLWSPDGQSFYFMCNASFAGNLTTYDARFEIREGNYSGAVKMRVDTDSATAFDGNDKQLATYERQDLDSVREIFAKLKAQEDLMIPLKTARKPEYIFMMENGQYIYVDAMYDTDNGDDFNVYVGTKGNMQKYTVEDWQRWKDGGTTTLSLANGGCIFCPTSFVKNIAPYFQATDTSPREALIRLDTATFDYSSIGIELEPLNPRPTMMDLFNASVTKE